MPKWSEHWNQFRKANDGVSGVYSIECKSSGRKWIGQSGNIVKRIAGHLARLQADDHKNHQFQYDFNTYGFGDFEFKVLARIDDARDRIQAEERITKEHEHYELYSLYECSTIEERRRIHGAKLDASTIAFIRNAAADVPDAIARYLYDQNGIHISPRTIRAIIRGERYRSV